MAVEQSIDTDKVLKKINKTIKEIKKGIPVSNLSSEDVEDIQKDLGEIKDFALTLKNKFQ